MSSIKAQAQKARREEDISATCFQVLVINEYVVYSNCCKLRVNCEKFKINNTRSLKELKED